MNKKITRLVSWGMVSGQISEGLLTMDQVPYRTTQPHGTPLEKTSPGLEVAIEPSSSWNPIQRWKVGTVMLSSFLGFIVGGAPNPD